MAIGSAQLSGSLQALIDTRLDTIDRMLLGRLSRADRLAIVSEVESQVFELLSGRDTEALTREDVLAVLARLDPPEAYLPEPAEGEAAPARAAVSPPRPRPSIADGARTAKVCGFAGISALVVLALSPLFYLISVALSSSILAILTIVGTLALIWVTGTASLVLAAVVRLKHRWAVVGLVTALIALTGSFGLGIFVLLDS